MARKASPHRGGGPTGRRDSFALLLQTKNYKLKTVATVLDVSLENAHRAVHDAIATAEVFIKLVDSDYQL